MKPEAVAPGLVAGDDRGVFGQSESLLGGLDLGQEDVAVPSRDRPEPGFLTQADGEGQLPVLASQLQGEIENRNRWYCRMLVVSRCHGKAPEKGIAKQEELNLGDSYSEPTSAVAHIV